MLDTGWDNDSAMMDDILTLEYTYAQEMEQSLGLGVPLMVTKPPQNGSIRILLHSLPCELYWYLGH